MLAVYSIPISWLYILFIYPGCIFHSYILAVHSHCQAWSGQATRNTCISKYNLVTLFLDGETCVEQGSSRREFAYTKELSVVVTASGNWLQPKLYCLKTPTQPTQYLFFFYWPWLIPMQWWFSIIHGLHPRIFMPRGSCSRIACFPVLGFRGGGGA